MGKLYAVCVHVYNKQKHANLIKVPEKRRNKEYQIHKVARHRSLEPHNEDNAGRDDAYMI